MGIPKQNKFPPLGDEFYFMQTFDCFASRMSGTMPRSLLPLSMLFYRKSGNTMKKTKKKPLRPDIKFHLIWKYSYKSYIRLKKPLWTIVRQSPSLSRLLGHYKLLLKLMGVNIACMSQMHTRLLLMCAFANIKVNKKKRFVSVLKL